LQVGSDNASLSALAGAGSPLARKHSLYLEHVAIACFPEDYDQRLSEMFPGQFGNLVLMAMDPYDLILTKLSANRPPDREDAKFIARAFDLRGEVMRDRYQKELRPVLIGSLRIHDITLQQWLEDDFEK
jgi:hypothetical protein